MKKIIASLYIVLLIVMAAATITETYTSTPFVQQHFYGSWWFIVLWGLLVSCGIAYILKRRLRKWNLLLLHCSTARLLSSSWALCSPISLLIGEWCIFVVSSRQTNTQRW